MSKRTRSKLQDTSLEVTSSIFHQKDSTTTTADSISESASLSSTDLYKLFNYAASKLQQIKLNEQIDHNNKPDSQFNRSNNGNGNGSSGNSTSHHSHHNNSHSSDTNSNSNNNTTSSNERSSSRPINMSIHVLFDDIFLKFFNKFPKNEFINNENALVIKLLPKIVAYLTNLKQMISNNIKPLRYFGLIIPFNNGNCWSLLWLKFPTSDSKYVTIYQVDPRTNHLNGLNYNLKYLTKLILCYLLDIEDIDDVTCNFHYVRPVLEDENLNDQDLVIYNTIKLLKEKFQ
ncbi:unnamed protein product [Ambrosiozyma monospora]|uniref:Unnamed protein product n=1 Tax=Ambrosiozyma monospora TaxID=43982 RepID=A0ACB5TVN1_AMBMO|nr:unnamed protein product [Ambrosiozyma monospora]